MHGAAARLYNAWAEDEQPASHVPKFSFEYFPPKTPQAVEALYNKVYRMGRQGPLFVDLTWGAGGSTATTTLSMCANFKKLFGLEANMHITCTNMTQDAVRQVLIEAKEAGITSIVALRGDPPAGSERWAETEGGFSSALDLVRFIRLEHGDYFSICVSGYPEGHPNVIKPVKDEFKDQLTETERGRLISLNGELMVCHDDDYANEIRYLKKKVEAGGSFIITQLFFDADVFLTFVDDCRQAGINVPILPGIMTLGHYAGFKRMTETCKTRVPQAMMERVEELKSNNHEFEEFGVEYLTAMCKKIWATNKVPELHFYCLNQVPAALKILANLGVNINPLTSDEDQQELERVAELVKETCAPAPKREVPTEENAEESGKRQKVVMHV